MLGELDVMMADLAARLTELRDEQENFRLLHEDTMNEFLFEKKMKEFDREIEETEMELRSAEKEYREVLVSLRDRR